MRIGLIADREQKNALLKNCLPGGKALTWLDLEGYRETDAVDIYFDCLFDETVAQTSYPDTGKLVFINAVSLTCAELPANCIRFNGWNGFLERRLLEVCAGDTARQKEAENILRLLNHPFSFVRDTPGMITPRIVAMIINEAYFGLGDRISTPDQIDTAMKLGTRYPYGPFEWAEKIGLKKIRQLLGKLGQSDPVYQIAPELEKAVIHQIPQT